MFKRGTAFYVRLYSDGRERWKSLGKNRSAAIDRYHKIKAGVEDTKVVPGAGSIAELGERWLTLLPTRRVASGVRDVSKRFRAHLVPFMGEIEAAKLTPGHIREYRIHLEGKKSAAGQPFKPETVRHFLRDLQCFCSWLEEEGYVEQSSFPKRIMPRVPDRGMERFTDQEVEKLLRLPEPYRWTVRLALTTGLRWGEITRVQASDVQKDGTLVFVQPKTGRSKAIPLPPDIVREVRGRVGKLVPFSPTSASSFTRKVKGIPV